MDDNETPYARDSDHPPESASPPERPDRSPDDWATGLEAPRTAAWRRRRRALIGTAGVVVAGGLTAGGIGLSSVAASAASKSVTRTAATAHLAGPGLRGGRGGLSGVVTAVGANSIVITTGDGSSVTVTTNSSTTYAIGRSSATAGAVATGDRVAIRSTSTSNASAPVAAEVDVIVPELSGTVVSNDGSTIVVTDEQGFQRAIHVTSSTTYSQASTTVSASSVTTESTIVAMGSIDVNKTDLDATSVEVILPHTLGTVTAISGKTITISTPAGASLTVETTATTTFKSGGSTTSLSAITVGSRIVVSGTKQSDGSFAASEVDLFGSGGPPAGMRPDGGPPGFGGPGGGGLGAAA